jgi:signal transduction histidine kinase
MHILSSFSFVKNSDNEVVGIVAVNRDISEYFEMQVKVHEAEKARIAIEKEREMIALREEFIATISHDFRTPLAVIMSSDDILRKYEGRLDESQRVKHLVQIYDQAKYMVDLLNDVLSLSKARAGKTSFDPVRINVEVFAQELFEQIQIQATADHTFSFVGEGDLAGAFMDTHSLQRVLLNLLSNAVKYSPQGGEVRFEVRRLGDMVQFVVRDEGIGIPEKDQAHIFEPFSRASNTRQIQGTGLGMAIVYETVVQQGGKVSLESREGAGTAVAVLVPYRQQT